MVLIPGGTFKKGINEEDLAELVKIGERVPHMNRANAKWWFGDEIPSHRAEVKPFLMDKYEVTNRQFKEFIKKTSYKAQGKWQKYASKDRMDHPVVNVTWHDARAYAKWAGKRLPTESEWEYAAKGGGKVKWYTWGNSPDPKMANYRYQGETFFSGIPRVLGLRKINTKPVGSYASNGYGIFDMCGNVGEWCDDLHQPYPGGPDDKGLYNRYRPKKDQEMVYAKVVRGGSWESPNPVFIRITSRKGFRPEYFTYNLGFRCVKSIAQK
jgi:formylglycine-generating enzyme required for sulfatase activity